MARSKTEQVSREPMAGEDIVALCRRYTIYDWHAQARIHPAAVRRAEGIYFYTTDGRRYLDFNSQLMSVHIGHGDRRVIEAIQRQAEELAYISPFMAHEARARLGEKLASLLPGDIDKVFFTLGGADANENAIRIARHVTGKQKILARYRSYHGNTSGAITLSGDPRRWPNEPGIPGVVHILDPHHGLGRPIDTTTEALRDLEETIQLEGPDTIAAFILEPVVGSNGILIPLDGYLQGVRSICDRYNILMIADEVMTGFGRTGEWFAVNHWNVVPDLISMAKGLTSSYVPLGAVGMRTAIADFFEENVFYGGMTYNSHPIACAAALATIRVYEEDDLVGNARRMGEVMRKHHQALLDAHPSVGAVRNIGLFGVLELVRSRSRMEPLSALNRTSREMDALEEYLWEHGLYTKTRWHMLSTNPPLCINEAQLAEGFSIIDRGLEVLDGSLEDSGGDSNAS